MNQSTRKLLQRLMSGRPRPSEKALSEFFVELKKHSVDELTRMCGEALEGIERAPPSPLVASIKKRLREFGGKATDFLPYLVDAASTQAKLDVARLPKSPSLGSVVQLVEGALGDAAPAVADEAFKNYARAHDISYKLKRG